MKVQIPFTIKYVSKNYSPAEENSFIECFLDGRFVRKPVSVHLERDHDVTVKGILKKGYEIDEETALCFASVSWRRNSSVAKSPCRLDTGVAVIEFGYIRDQIKKHGKCVAVLPLRMYTCEAYEKATIEIHIEDFNIELKPKPLGYSISQKNTLINNYIGSTVEVEQKMGETFGPQTSNMRMPYNYSESGIQSTNGSPLPAVSYVMSETPPSNDAFWENAFKVIMDRDGLKLEDWDKLNIKGQSRVAVHMVCYVSQYLDYISDTIDKNTPNAPYVKSKIFSFENFGDGLGLWGGDCEDLASSILQVLNSHLTHDFDKKRPLYKTFEEIKKILLQYVPPLSLDVVRGAQVSAVLIEYGAHMNDNFIPRKMFKDWMSNTREGRKLVKQLPWGDGADIEGLPFLVGEGTGMYECYGVANPLVNVMGYVYQCQSLGGFKTPISRAVGVEGNFFVGSLVGMTDFFQKRGSVPMAFWYCDKSKGMSRGASYHDMMNNPDNVAIKVQPPYSKEILIEMEKKTLRRLPPMPLILTPVGNDSKRHFNYHLDFICKSINSLNRSPGSLHHKALVFVRGHQLSTELCRDIVSDFTRLDKIWKVEYKLEEITDFIWGYRMDVFVKV